eukprot:8279402-Pyramimonas_sp.AAC.1
MALSKARGGSRPRRVWTRLEILVRTPPWARVVGLGSPGAELLLKTLSRRLQILRNAGAEVVSSKGSGPLPWPCG